MTDQTTDPTSPDEIETRRCWIIQSMSVDYRLFGQWVAWKDWSYTTSIEEARVYVRKGDATRSQAKMVQPCQVVEVDAEFNVPSFGQARWIAQAS
jgi:hypothetical protein